MPTPGGYHELSIQLQRSRRIHIICTGEPAISAYLNYICIQSMHVPVFSSTSLEGHEDRCFFFFSVIIQTYDRPDGLKKALLDLVDLPNVDKILVIWNSQVVPDGNFRWPDVHVPLQVVHSSVNSMNNRFLPYTQIETEAIFLIDDDLIISHEKIIAAFR